MNISSIDAQQSPQKLEKSRKQAKNVAYSAVGLVGTNFLHNIAKDAYCYVPKNERGRIDWVSKNKFSRAVDKFGEKIFKHPKINQLFERHIKGLENKEISGPIRSEAFVKIAKGKAAMALVAGVSAACILANFLYQAGKINGESK